MRQSKNKTSASHPKAHPDHKAQLQRLNRIKGQVEGVGRMISEKRYCVDIMTQIRAARAALKSLEAEVLETHLKHCVIDAFNSKGMAQKNAKIKEIIELFE